ncbi:xylose isomerase-like protein [Amanita rubescens]|nr:xylose isomerase-like protein [Amanita rubescens]
MQESGCRLKHSPRQRKWNGPPLTEESISLFKSRLKRAKREKSYECFIDDLKRREQLGLELYNFHPGSTVVISYTAEGINRAHKETQYVKIVIENMAGSGNVIGSNYAELAGIINLYIISEFDEKVGLKYLRGMHLNDSKVDVGSKRDRHENIGLGFLGIRTFAHILSDQGIPLILETQSFEKPREVWGMEIQHESQIALTMYEVSKYREG